MLRACSPQRAQRMASYQYIFTMQNLRKVFGSGKEVLKGIHLQFFPGAKIGILGHNGAGKSTLLKTILGVVEPERGLVELGGTKLFCSSSGIDVPTEERRIGYVPQRYALFSHMSVIDNVGFGIRGVSKEERRKRAMDLLEDLGVAHLESRKTPALSGGESQRVALARALAIQPRAILLDEPMAALDAGARRKVRRFLIDRLKRVRVPTLVVSHDIDDVEAFESRIAVLEGGRILQLGKLDELRDNPASDFVRDFVTGTESTS